MVILVDILVDTLVDTKWLLWRFLPFWVSVSAVTSCEKKSRVTVPARSFPIGLEVYPGKLVMRQYAVAPPPC